MERRSRLNAMRDRGTVSGISRPERVSTGITGLDEILDSGFLARRRYLVRGGPGLGKTTLGLNFLTAVGDVEPSLFIGFHEPEAELRANAASIGIDTSRVNFLSLAPTEEFFTGAGAHGVFAASDVQQTPMTNAVIRAVYQTRPVRVFIDSLTQLRFISADLAQFRKQVMSFLRFLSDRGATVLFTSESTREVPDDDLQFISDGIIDLQRAPSCGYLTITKFRGSGFQRGAHEFRVDSTGFHVHNRILPPPQQIVESTRVQMSSGNADLDAMLGGGVEAGTVSLLTGPTGIGKSTLGGLFAIETARSGRAAVYQFEEEINGWMARLRALGVDPDTPLREGRLVLEQVEPLRYLASEFTNTVCRQVREKGLDLVVIDSVGGFELALGGTSEEVRASLHALIKTLSRMGVTVVLLNENHAVVGNLKASEREISYIADNVIYLCYVQTGDALAKVLGIMKKRLSAFDSTQREFDVTTGGVRIGRPASALGASVGPGQASEEHSLARRTVEGSFSSSISPTNLDR
jgi:circadian clock protein KaiC